MLELSSSISGSASRRIRRTSSWRKGESPTDSLLGHSELGGGKEEKEEKSSLSVYAAGLDQMGPK